MNTVTSKADKVKLHKRFNLYYLYDSEGVLWLNVRNLSQLVGEGSRITAPLHYITKKLPKKDKLINNPYGNKSGALYIKERQVGKVKERIKNTNLDNTLINSLESSIENIKEMNNMNKHLNTLKFKNSNDQPSEVKWFVDDDQVVWYDSVNILSNLGFTKSGFTIKEEIGKIYLERNEPKKLRAGRIHWNKESISVLKEIIDEKVKDDFWDNIEIIFNLVNSEIEKYKESFEKLLKVNCHIVSDLTNDQAQFLLGNGWVKSKSQQAIPLHGKVFIIYNRSETKLTECKEYLKKFTGFDVKLEKIHQKVCEEVGDRGYIKTSIISEKFNNSEMYFAYKYLKDNNFVEDKSIGVWLKDEKINLSLLNYAGFLKYDGKVAFGFKAFNSKYDTAVSFNSKPYRKFLSDLASQGFISRKSYGLTVLVSPADCDDRQVFIFYKEFLKSSNLDIVRLNKEESFKNYTAVKKMRYLKISEGEAVYQNNGETYVRVYRVDKCQKAVLERYLLNVLGFTPCYNRDSLVILPYTFINGDGVYKHSSSKKGCSKDEIDTFIRNLSNKDINDTEDMKTPCKEEKPNVEFLPTPTKTIKYKELISSKGWWVFKKEVWETKEIDVYEDEVDSFVSSLTNNCEIIEIK